MKQRFLTEIPQEYFYRSLLQSRTIFDEEYIQRRDGLLSLLGLGVQQRIHWIISVLSTVHTSI